MKSNDAKSSVTTVCCYQQIVSSQKMQLCSDTQAREHCFRQIPASNLHGGNFGIELVSSQRAASSNNQSPWKTLVTGMISQNIVRCVCTESDDAKAVEQYVAESISCPARNAIGDHTQAPRALVIQQWEGSMQGGGGGTY
jgi:hypothetical protein